MAMAKKEGLLRKQHGLKDSRIVDRLAFVESGPFSRAPLTSAEGEMRGQPHRSPKSSSAFCDKAMLPLVTLMTLCLPMEPVICGSPSTWKTLINPHQGL